eukprot:TRINITY_DN3979_c1_g1_i1.p1 TRINITY_DN3979_c1_g1~~TRINITY_DN3979_c1_g1_i1.p1  ORF type:complete len:183 (-),score=32.45 TRINITY_DN3979_c1_g1_i1:347-895(-)
MSSAAMPRWPEEECANAATRHIIVKNTFIHYLEIDNEGVHKPLKRSKSWCGAGSLTSDTWRGDSMNCKVPPASQDASSRMCDAGSGTGVAGEHADAPGTKAGIMREGEASAHQGHPSTRGYEADQQKKRGRRRPRPSKYARAECRAMVKMVQETVASDPNMKDAKLAEMSKGNEYIRRLAQG